MPLPTGLPNTATGSIPGPNGTTLMLLLLLPGSLLVLLRLTPLSALPRRTPPSALLRPALSATGQLRQSRARERSLKEDQRLLAVADVAARSEDDLRCRRLKDALGLLLLVLYLLPGLCASAESTLLVVWRRERLTGCVEGSGSLLLLLVVRIARARMMCGCVLLLFKTSSATTMRRCAGPDGAACPMRCNSKCRQSDKQNTG